MSLPDRADEIQKKILVLLKKQTEPLSKRQIAIELNETEPTVGKYVDILVAKNELELKDYGAIHLITIKKSDKHE